MKGCLLIHGYTGAPFEVIPLAQYLEALGFFTLCPTLHGHNGTRRDLRQSSCKDWLQSVEDAYMELADRCSEIAILGFSMGGLLAIYLAAKYQPKCIVTMGTPIYCFDIKNLYFDILSNLYNKNFSRILEYMKACTTPLQSNLHFKKIVWQCKPLINKINIPILIVHGKKDPVAHYRSAYYIYNHVQSKRKEIKVYNHLRHQLRYSDNPKAVYADIGIFVQQYL